MTLEHLGIAVTDADAAVAVFERLLGAPPYKQETVSREGVRTLFFGDGGRAHAAPKLELLEALSPDSPIAGFLEKRGPGLHHVAFEVADIEAEMARLNALGFRLLAEQPKPGADGKRIVFFHPKSTAGVLVELCETVWAPERLDVPFEGGTLAAFASGPSEAQALVVLHGALDTSDGQVAPLVKRWSRRFRVYALDFPAHGASDDFEGMPLGTEALTGGVAALLDMMDTPITALFGYSLGGDIALHVANRYPGRLSHLALHAAHVQWRADEQDAMVARAEALLADPEQTWQTALAAAHGADRWPRLYERMRDFEHAFLPDRTLAGLPIPTLLSVGDRDAFLEPALHLHAKLPASTLAVLPGMGHLFSALSPTALDRYADLVAEHLSGGA